MKSHSISTPNVHHCNQRNTKLNQQAIHEENEKINNPKSICHYTPIQLSLSLSKNTHVGGWGWWKRKKERRGYNLRMHQGTCKKITKEMYNGRNNNT